MRRQFKNEKDAARQTMRNKMWSVFPLKRWTTKRSFSKRRKLKRVMAKWSISARSSTTVSWRSSGWLVKTICHCSATWTMYWNTTSPCSRMISPSSTGKRILIFFNLGVTIQIPSADDNGCTKYFIGTACSFCHTLCTLDHALFHFWKPAFAKGKQ